MRSSKTSIEINGKIYNARTGELMQSTKPAKAAPGQAMDGVVRKTIPAAAPSKQASRVAHSVTAPKTHHSRQQKAQTLMRHAVKKPGNKGHKQHLGDQIVGQSPVETANIAIDPTEPVSRDRVVRAMKVQQSTFISRFGGGKSPVSKTTAHIPVHPVPATTYAEPKAPKPIHEPKQAHHTAAAHTKSVTSPIHHALQHATSHEQTYKAKKVRKHHKIANRLGIHRRVVSGAAMAFAVLTLGGFIAYQNMANITMRVASARAGINANMPDYQPSGFALSGPVNYSPGKVVLSFKSNTDQRSFELKQQASNWNSETLLQNIVANNTKSYQTYEDKGKTIYIYDGSNATWVDGGILYKIEGSSSLSNDQLIRMAASL